MGSYRQECARATRCRLSVTGKHALHQREGRAPAIRHGRANDAGQRANALKNQPFQRIRRFSGSIPRGQCQQRVGIPPTNMSNRRFRDMITDTQGSSSRMNSDRQYTTIWQIVNIKTHKKVLTEIHRSWFHVRPPLAGESRRYGRALLPRHTTSSIRPMPGGAGNRKRNRPVDRTHCAHVRPAKQYCFRMVADEKPSGTEW